MWPRRAGRVASVALFVRLIACVGDDPSGGSAAVAGTAGGPCFPNGTCNVGLTCDRGTACVPNDGGTVDGSTEDAASNDGGTDAADDAADACAYAASTTSSLECGAVDTCDAASVCCFGNTVTSCISATGGGPCSTGAKEHRCESPAWCGASTCCLKTTAALDTQSACPRTLTQSEFGGTACGPCAGGDFAVCANDVDCVGGRTCHAVDVTSSLSGKLHLGICLPR